jgi:hypothetical protein
MHDYHLSNIIKKIGKNYTDTIPKPLLNPTPPHPTPPHPILKFIIHKSIYRIFSASN